MKIIFALLISICFFSCGKIGQNKYEIKFYTDQPAVITYTDMRMQAYLFEITSDTTVYFTSPNEKVDYCEAQIGNISTVNMFAHFRIQIYRNKKLVSDDSTYSVFLNKIYSHK